MGHTPVPQKSVKCTRSYVRDAVRDEAVSLYSRNTGGAQQSKECSGDETAWFNASVLTGINARTDGE